MDETTFDAYATPAPRQLTAANVPTLIQTTAMAIEAADEAAASNWSLDAKDPDVPQYPLLRTAPVAAQRLPG